MRLIVFAALLCGAAGDSWTYDAQDKWPRVCRTGKQQSPIDFRPEDADRVNIAELRFLNYNSTGAFIVTGNGKSVRVYGFGGWQPRPYIDGGGLDGNYTLDEVHFHWYRKAEQLGSEHSVNGTRYPIEIHMVHRGQIEGQEHIAVVAIFVQPDPTKKKAYNGIDRLFKTIAAVDDVESPVGGDRSAFSGERWFQPQELLPADLTRFYRYEGSLTTPDCDEIVTWTVMEEAQSIPSFLTEKLTNLQMRNGPTEFVHNQRQQQSRRRYNLRDPTATKTMPSKTSSNSAHDRCAFWPLATALVALLIVGVKVPDGIFF